MPETKDVISVSTAGTKQEFKKMEDEFLDALNWDVYGDEIKLEDKMSFLEEKKESKPKRRPFLRKKANHPRKQNTTSQSA